MARDEATRIDAESQRLADDSQRRANWKRWGPYLSERQWGTVREDYSPDGSCWSYFSHDQARSRAYRWGEDGLLGITDRECRLCFALALWNGKDPILKERLFGLTGPEGNHGEDVKECYYYLDSTPTHSYMKALYKYPTSAYPYAQLIEESHRRGKNDAEFELEHTGILDRGHCDVTAEYAKAAEDDICIRITVTNHGQEKAELHVLPTLWFRNTWVWGPLHEGVTHKPSIKEAGSDRLRAHHESLGRLDLVLDKSPDGKQPAMLFTDNESNLQACFGIANTVPYTKDAFHRYVIHGEKDAVNPESSGTKAAAHYVLSLYPGQTQVLRMRLTATGLGTRALLGPSFDETFQSRIAEADAFYAQAIPASLDEQQKQVARQAYAGLLWTKQFYHYIVYDWARGDRDMPPPPPQRKQHLRNRDWKHVYSRDVISMPDKWEYPWFAAWDLAFHMLPMCRVDPDFAKKQLMLLLREWYMHPNGQVPAYEFAFDDVNPPVHAWACWRVYKMTGPRGQRDTLFLARTFQKLMLNFTWWVNRKDPSGRNIFAGGFLGLDNIGVFDRSRPLPTGGHLEQADGTAWMAFFCGTMLNMALELAQHDRSYEDIASKFFEHYVHIADAINTLGGCGLWDECDGFYYDQLMIGAQRTPLKVRSMVGLIPLFAAEIIDAEVIGKLHEFRKRTEWFLKYRKDLAKHVAFLAHHSGHSHLLLALPSKHRLHSVLKYLLDETEFLSPYGVRSLSKIHGSQPFVFQSCGQQYSVRYTPGESDTDLFGGNSNWRGPIWFPVNYLLIESLERYHLFYGDDLKVECPTGSGQKMNLKEVAQELARRLSTLFVPAGDGLRPCYGDDARYANDPNWRSLLQFHEYFHGETGKGLGANHQTGWTALVINCLEKLAKP